MKPATMDKVILAVQTLILIAGLATMATSLCRCAALDETANHAFNDVVCTENMCDDDQVCVAQKCRWKCQTEAECDPGEGCLPTAQGTLMCFNKASYDKLVPKK